MDTIIAIQVTKTHNQCPIYSHPLPSLRQDFRAHLQITSSSQANMFPHTYYDD
jgi:hypothetical protein